MELNILLFVCGYQQIWILLVCKLLLFICLYLGKLDDEDAILLQQCVTLKGKTSYGQFPDLSKHLDFFDVSVPSSTSRFRNTKSENTLLWCKILHAVYIENYVLKSFVWYPSCVILNFRKHWRVLKSKTGFCCFTNISM